jgi:tetratricopeptide (TPR) repeat protein
MEPAIIWSLAILLGISLAQGKIETPASTRLGKAANFWVVAPIAAAWLGIWLVWPFHQGVNLANQNQWQVAQEMFAVATQRDPGSSIVHQQLAIVDSVLAYQGDQSALQTAIDELQLAITHEPSWALNHANLAALYATQGDLEKAQIAALKSVELAPEMALYQLNLGSIAEQNLDNAVSRQAYMAALKLEPAWATSDYWNASELRKQALTDWITQNPPVSKPSLTEIEATFQANQQSTWAYNKLAQAYLDKGKPEQAEKLLNNASLAYANLPKETIETMWLKAEVSATKGDFKQAIALGEQALQTYRAFGVFGPGSFGILYYAPRMFRSPAMALEIVPQMVEVPVPEVWVEREKQLSIWQ